ncbi:MAG: hypothetical protein ACE5HX_15855, partial [bacterium]
ATALLQVESYTSDNLQVEYRIKFPDPLEPKNIPNDMNLTHADGGHILSSRFELIADRDKWWRVIDIDASDGAESGEYVISSEAQIINTATGKSWKAAQENVVLMIKKTELRNYFDITNVILPTDHRGGRDENQQINTILLRRQTTAFESFLSRKTEQVSGMPTHYAAVTINNSANFPATLAVTIDILDPKTKERAPGFELPPELDYPGDRVQIVVNVREKSGREVVMPIWAVAGRALPGDYVMKVNLEHFGTGTIVAEHTLPIKVVGTLWIPTMVAIISLLTSIGSVGVIYLKRKSFGKFPTRDLVTVSLFSAVIFAAVNIPFVLVRSIANAILGPFSSLIIGFFNEILYYILLIALVVLIPKIGVVTLMLGVRFLLNGILFGGFSPLGFLVVSTAAVTTEAGLWLCGITRKRNPHAQKADYTLHIIIFAAIVLGIIDAYNTFIYWNLRMFLFRLFFADWYIVLTVIISGFLYTAIAVPTGFKLGRRLKKVSEV